MNISDFQALPRFAEQRAFSGGRSFTDQINSVSGVSLNEEGANLIQYQNAYTAASRVASVVASLYQTAINMVPAI